MRAIHVGLILLALALFMITPGCSTSPAGHPFAAADQAAIHNRGPEGCHIPDANGRSAAQPTTRPSLMMSPIPTDMSPIPTKG